MSADLKSVGRILAAFAGWGLAHFLWSAIAMGLSSLFIAKDHWVWQDRYIIVASVVVVASLVCCAYPSGRRLGRKIGLLWRYAQG